MITEKNDSPDIYSTSPGRQTGSLLMIIFCCFASGLPFLGRLSILAAGLIVHVRVFCVSLKPASRSPLVNAQASAIGRHAPWLHIRQNHPVIPESFPYPLPYFSGIPPLSR